jgi:hypothetical protein
MAGPSTTGTPEAGINASCGSGNGMSGSGSMVIRGMEMMSGLQSTGTTAMPAPACRFTMTMA